MLFRSTNEMAIGKLVAPFLDATQTWTLPAKITGNVVVEPAAGFTYTKNFGILAISSFPTDAFPANGVNINYGDTVIDIATGDIYMCYQIQIGVASWKKVSLLP